MVQTDASIVEIRKQIHDKDLKRYVLSVVSGQESLVIENMQERVQKQGLTDDIVDYLSPVVNEYSLKKGEKIIKHKKMYPWYVFIRSRMNDKIWYIIRNTPGVRLIVWAETRPVPLTDAEYQDIINHVKKSQERAELAIPYKKWDVVTLKAWDFNGMQWKVKKVDSEKWTVIVNVEMLGRLTPVVIDADKIELMS